jgi:hypothetical protein
MSIATISQAQISQNNWMLGGIITYEYISYNSTNYGDPHIAQILNANPNIGYFAFDKAAVGIRTSFGRSAVVGGSSYTDFNIGPFIRYYLLNPDRYVNIIADAGYLYGFEKWSGAPGNAPKNSFSFSAGPVFYFNSVVGLEFLVSYSTYKYTSLPRSNNTIMLGLGFQVHLETEK